MDGNSVVDQPYKFGAETLDICLRGDHCWCLYALGDLCSDLVKLGEGGGLARRRGICRCT